MSTFPVYGTTSTSIRRFGRANGAASLASAARPLTLDQIKASAPSIFALGKHDSRSERYSYIPTAAVLEHLMSRGFNPFAVMQGGSRDEEKRGFTKHLIRLRHESAMDVQVGGTLPEVVLINSHDGTSAYRMMAGLFRLVCANGMVVCVGQLADVRVPHTGDDAPGMVLDGCIEVLGRLPQVNQSVSHMQALRLTDGEARAFATAALVARYGTEPAPITPNQVLAIRREEDRDPSLWNVLNRSQESLIRGGERYTQTRRDEAGRPVAVTRRRTREVQSVDGNVHVNRALWALAEEMRKLKSQG